MNVTAHAQRDGRWWAVTIPDVEGGIHTQARRLDQVPAMVADAVGTILNIDPATVTVDVVPELPDELRELVDQAREASAAFARAQADAASAMRAAVNRLHDAEHLTTRDTAALLGVSHQRVAQLAK